MKKMDNKIAKKAMMFLLVVVFMLVGTTSGVAKADGIYDGGRMVENKKVLKKLRKNAWTPESNPESKALSYGYAVSKIKEFIEADDQAMVRELGYVSKFKQYTGRKLKFSAATKGQREAIKWAVETALISASWTSNDPYGGITDGHKLLTRAELVDLLSRVLDAYYPYRVPYIYESKYGYLESVSDDTNLSALYKGVVISAAYDEKAFGAADKVRINLDAQATREDLKLALKNLKIVVNNLAVKVTKNPTGQYSYEKACADAEDFVKTLYEKTGYKMSVSKIDGTVRIVDGFNTIMYLEDKNGKNWYPNINFSYSSSISDKKASDMISAEKYDVIKMLLESCILRAVK